MLPSTCKVSKLLNLTESSLLVLSFILLAGDIHPQPGPGNVSDVPTLSFNARGLSVVHLNVRSLLGKMDQLRLLCQRNGVDIMTLSETWLIKGIDDGEIELPGYSIIRRDRGERIGGGVIIYIRDGLVFTERNDFHNNNEAIWIQVNRSRCKPLIIGCIYRPPNQQVDKFLEDFNNSSAGIESHSDKIILGDFNIDYSSKKKRNANQSDRRKLKGIADLHDIQQIIDFPTRIAEHSESQIDLIFTDNVHKIVDFGVKDFGISDHSMVYCVFKSGVMKVPPKTLEYRSFKSYNKSSFRQDLMNVPWHFVFNNPEDLEGCVQTWNKLFLQVAEDHAPTKTRRVRGTPTPWVTSEIATLMRDRIYHLTKAKGNKTNYHWKRYRALRNKVQRKIKKFKYLGIVINNRLTWQDHVDQMFSKINKKLGLLKRIRYCLPLDPRLLFFNSYVLPLFDYADIVWGDRGNSTLMLQLQSLHNKGAKIILDLPIGLSASVALNKLKWKTLARRRAEHRATFIYKCLNNLFSHRFNIEFNKDKHDYNTRRKNNIRKSASSRNWGHWTLTNFASNDWNKLDLLIRQSPSLASSKRALRNVNSL